ncbi:signal-regulatory protein beta-1-like, partial [Anomaloglossus baeobatrachus]|uniref:signal-regulatory protein beta-1-like n=1 Tax=Anomaloglossus baeobatrachus TaxID=238106 RepID=UPI003F500253
MEAMKGFLCLLLRCLSVSSLEVTGPSINIARLGSDAHVPCTFTVDKPPVDPKHLTILWRFLEKQILSYKFTVRTTSPRYSLNTEALRTGAANLTISNIQIPDGGRYKCSVIYKSEGKKNEVWLDIQAPPLVTITDKKVVLNLVSVLRCSATGFFPIDIEVTWFRGSERLSDVTLDDPQRNPDKTYSVNSTVTITPTEEDREQNFSCRVQHKYLQEPLREHFCLVYQVPPVVVLHNKTVRKGTENTLLCEAYGFSPPDIDITWTLDGKIQNNSFLGEPVENKDGTYNVRSSVTFTPTPEAKTLSCTVHHASLHDPLQEDLLLVYEGRISAGTIGACSVSMVTLMIFIIATVV